MTNANVQIITDISTGTAPLEAVIEINNLEKGFSEQDVLKNVSLKLFNGENLVVLGKSGSGKSVLIKCIAGLMHPDGGTIEVLGNKIDSI